MIGNNAYTFVPVKLRTQKLKVYARIGLLQLLTLALAVGFWYSPNTLSAAPGKSIASFSTTHHGAEYTSNNSIDSNHAPAGIPSEEQTLEEILEDLNESQHEASLAAAFGMAFLARADVSAEEDLYRPAGLFHNQSPLYVLFHSWKSFLV